MCGFNDELSEIHQQKIYSDLEQIAYNWGRIDAIVGDDVSSTDLQTNDEIPN